VNIVNSVGQSAGQTRILPSIQGLVRWREKKIFAGWDFSLRKTTQAEFRN